MTKADESHKSGVRRSLRLGVNIDHAATLRNARGGPFPDPVAAARMALNGGADGITAHLREDRRHIRDADIARIKAEIAAPLNLEMAATEEMLGIALATRPNACCLVPERREERTTEGGLDVAGGGVRLAGIVKALKSAGIRVSLFIEPEAEAIAAAAAIGADIVELHTGLYCECALAGDTTATARQIARLAEAANRADAEGLEVHAGHGLTYDTVAAVARMPEIVELNIGHFLIGASLEAGLAAAVARMRQLMLAAREAS
ncbi:MAG: pyridoxine 5'-phosphate synthase [Hyphomicrobiaceae bacterium]|nr:pyridoxine 5'-phosphate synthase [Hyphomicrobiaceae bacterium]